MSAALQNVVTLGGPDDPGDAAQHGVLGYGDGCWQMLFPPHIAIRARRMFPRARPDRAGYLRIANTPEVARDLEWLRMRHPFAFHTEFARRQLFASAAEHRELADVRTSILAGRHAIEGLREPVRAPRDYQRLAADLTLAGKRLLLADDVGLGKTFSSMLLFRDPATLPAVYVTLTHLPKQMLGELNKSFPWLRGHVVTKGKPYPVVADVLFINYHKLVVWADELAGLVNTVIFDEVQELRHTGTQKYWAASRVAHKATWKMGLSATPVYNYGGEIHSILSVLDESALGARDEFLREWGASDYNGKLKVRDPAALGAYLQSEGLMLRRTRKDVARELPPVNRIVHEVDSDPAALEAVAGDVRAMAELLLHSTNRQERFQAAGEMDWRLRQATGIAKAPYVAEFVRLLLESEDRVVLFGWHRAVYELWADLLDEFNPVFYTGTESPNQKDAAAQAFTVGDSRVLVMSLRAGAGLDGLQEAASVAVFGELDWSPAMHHQAIGRLHRDGQEWPVTAYFLVANEGSDPVVSDVLELKRQQAEPIIDPGAPVLATTEVSPQRMRRLAEAVLADTPRRSAPNLFDPAATS